MGHSRARAVVLAAMGMSVLAAVAGAGDLPPARRARLRAWLESGAYRATYTPEPEVHRSLGPHGANVRTWYSAGLVEDLRAGRVPFRRGAAMVKELLYNSESEVVGWAVMRKVRARSGRRGRGWLFFEAFPGGSYFGRGTPVCTGCHERGVDYLLSEFRP